MKVKTPCGREVTIVNIKDTPNWKELYPNGVYCGRPPKSQPGMHLGNLFTHLQLDDPSRTIWVPTREVAVQAFERWLKGDYDPMWPLAKLAAEEQRRLWILKVIPKIQEKAEALACWCDPLMCHTEVLATFVPTTAPTTTTQVFYTGVGTRGRQGFDGVRRLPQHMTNLIRRVSRWKRDKGEILRSGHAVGSDLAFEMDTPVWQKEIYLPTEVFNKASASTPGCIVPDEEQLEEAFDFLQRIGVLEPRHAAKLKSGTGFGWRAHARNLFQVIGVDIENPRPSKSLYCYTEDGEEVGGTRTAILVARHFDVKVINLGNKDVAAKCGHWLEKNGY